MMITAKPLSRLDRSRKFKIDHLHTHPLGTIDCNKHECRPAVKYMHTYDIYMSCVRVHVCVRGKIERWSNSLAFKQAKKLVSIAFVNCSKRGRDLAEEACHGKHNG